MSGKANDVKSLQKTCFIFTVNLGHICKKTDWSQVSEDEKIWQLEQHWAEVQKLPNAAIGRAQIERNSSGELHINGGIKFSKVWRARTLENKWRCWAEPAIDEQAVMRYGKKTETRVKALENFGAIVKKKTGPKSPKLKAVQWILEGLTPAEICVKDPEVYFTHHRSILETYKMLSHAKAAGIGRVDNWQEEE